MTKIMHVAEPFATGVLSFLVDITKRQVEDYEVYILWGVRPLTPPNVESLFDRRVHLIKIDSFKGAFGLITVPIGFRKTSAAFPTSTIFPRYMTAIRSLT